MTFSGWPLHQHTRQRRRNHRVRSAVLASLSLYVTQRRRERVLAWSSPTSLIITQNAIKLPFHRYLPTRNISFSPSSLHFCPEFSLLPILFLLFLFSFCLPLFCFVFVFVLFAYLFGCCCLLNIYLLEQR